MKQLVLSIRINVLDEPTFIRSAKEFYHSAWQQELEADDLGTAALELIALSNMNPTPVDLGFEFVSYEHSEVAPCRNAANAGVSIPLQCQSCNFKGDRSECLPATDLLSRVNVGEPFTDRECPDCGALAHPIDDKPFSSLAVMQMFLIRQDEYTSSLPKEEASLDLARLAMTLAMMTPDDAVSYALEVLSEIQS